ncbi:4-hydroxy-tetrahydrodipicolinate synthase [Crocinitomicaceae bacterium]|nr:4-hydroxy-tetrahydrodipicolinate synthase [Crocinitomicaceae bacterium]MDC0100544.1 4-hydroxy-tetrahydrodipicolinate synthase [Crocinitomicaceae bacterium]MDC1282677.1 4-hydroxy-tetrahydrodipicolinate synthase [Crocinitomicaceae bacterium]MDC1384574.1 4-hydroxy-tetrahydrodipicolinate synthase [Crocinitomicaceae bacterium]|tara:strand:+ start:11726 stop:12607 length:882 start_codon:yes stop_codon:yes gene_type:complete
MNNPFKGSGVALVTPFNDDLSIDFDALRKLVNYQIDNGTDFLVVQGTTGESPTLSKEEKLEVLKCVQDENKGRLKIVFGIGGNNTVEVGAFLKSISNEGLDGILSVSPYYNKPTQKGIVEHYKYLASCTPLPIILYNVPGRTASNVSAATTLELAKIDNIVAMKEASGDFSQIMEIVQNKPEGFDVLSGDDAITMPMMAVGVTGVISVVANAYPKRFAEMVHAAANDDMDLARAAHYDLLPVTHMLFEEGNPGGVKVALEKQGIMKPLMRMPLYPISQDLRTRIENETERIIG